MGANLEGVDVGADGFGVEMNRSLLIILIGTQDTSFLRIKNMPWKFG